MSLQQKIHTYILPALWCHVTTSSERSLTVLLHAVWELYTCDQPYQGLSEAQVVNRKGQQCAGLALPFCCPAAYAQLCSDCLQTDPCDRWDLKSCRFCILRLVLMSAAEIALLPCLSCQAVFRQPSELSLKVSMNGLARQDLGHGHPAQAALMLAPTLCALTHVVNTAALTVVSRCDTSCWASSAIALVVCWVNLQHHLCIHAPNVLLLITEYLDCVAVTKQVTLSVRMGLHARTKLLV